MRKERRNNLEVVANGFYSFSDMAVNPSDGEMMLGRGILLEANGRSGALGQAMGCLLKVASGFAACRRRLANADISRPECVCVCAVSCL